MPLGVGVTVTVGVGVGVVGVGVGVTGVAVGVGVGVGVATAAQNTSVDIKGVTPSMSYPPDNTILVVPSVSVGKLRRALANGAPVVQLLLAGS